MVKFIDRIVDAVFSPFMFTALAVTACVTSCSTTQATRSARSIHLIYGEGSGSFDSRGGFKTSDDVWRGGMGGDMDVHSWSIGWSPFAYMEDPDVGRTNQLLSNVLRARAEEPPKNVVPDAPIETPARPVLDLPLVESAPPQQPTRPWWESEILIGAISTVLLAVIAKQGHTAYKQRRTANASARARVAQMPANEPATTRKAATPPES